MHLARDIAGFRSLGNINPFLTFPNYEKRELLGATLMIYQSWDFFPLPS
jgi:hypothetical protein